MTTQDILEHLEKTQREADENGGIVELSQSELDEITGARGGDSFANMIWPKAH